MRNRLEHLQSPSAPTQPTYTHLSHTALCTNSDCTCITHRKNTARTSACRSHSSHSLSHAHTHYAHTHSHTRGLLAVSPAVEIGQPTPALVSVVLQSQSALHFLLRLTFLLRHALINILHGFYMDLFSFLLLSPRGAMATFSCLFNDCGWTINNLHTSKHSTTPTRCCRLNSQSEGKDMFSKKNTHKKNMKLELDGGLEKSSRVSFASLNLPRRSGEYSLGPFYKLLRWTWIILGVDHVKDLLGWFVLCLRQLVSEREKKRPLWSPGW